MFIFEICCLCIVTELPFANTIIYKNGLLVLKVEFSLFLMVFTDNLESRGT
jgi:hypothetical protein